MKLNDAPYADYVLKDASNEADKIMTGNGDSAGTATFTLSPSQNQTANIEFTVPYGTYLEVAEVTTAVISESQTVSQIYDTTVRANSGPEVTTDSYTFDSVSGDQKLTFTNMRKANDLTITKSVTGGMGDLTKEFSFTIEGLPADGSYNWTKYSDSGMNPETGTFQNGKCEFRLSHFQRITIEAVPHNIPLTITESDNDLYTVTWAGNNSSIVTVTPDTNNPSKATITIKGNNNAIITVTNDLPAVAPTSFTTRHTPFLFLLLIGILLLIGGGVVAKRRRGDNPDDGGTVAVNHTQLNTGPPGGAKSTVTMTELRKPTDTPQPTHSTTDTESHIRWRNSVWVEERANGSYRGYVPQTQGNISCPQAKLWMNGGGDAG